jgi:hypothetical protein
VTLVAARFHEEPFACFGIRGFYCCTFTCRTLDLPGQERERHDQNSSPPYRNAFHIGQLLTGVA